MNYKNLALIMLLLPITSLGSSNEVRIKELEEVRFEKELEISHLGKDIRQRLETLVDYKKMALFYWNPSSENKVEKENSFDQFLDELSDQFIDSVEINSIIEKEIKKQNALPDLRFTTLLAMFETILIYRMQLRYEELIKKLTVINKELNNLNT